ncbi:hypothetical protein [Kribbella sp. NPDC048915]|uniref:hypothetical protein n=1 Tax=Kribbella sp. NPDC048915 TaxID=3155148 RepID=UPI0033E20421
MTADEPMLERCQQVVNSRPDPMVLVALIGALRGSYHRKAVHGLVEEMARQSVSSWRAGDRGIASRDLAREAPQAFAYGAREADAEFVLEMWDEAEFTAEGEYAEDFRAYWSLAAEKIKDPRVADFARGLLQADLGNWSDNRLLGAMRVISKAWKAGDEDMFQRVALEHPDAEMRRDAMRILKRHSAV